MAISTGKIKALLSKIIGERTRWLGNWVNQLYRKNDFVFDDGWLMNAKRDTTERAGVQPLGTSKYIYLDVPSWSQDSSLARIYSGHVYEFIDGGWISQIRVWVPAVTVNTTYRVVIIDITDTENPITTVIEDPNLASAGWTVISSGKRIIQKAQRFLVYLDSINSGSDTVVTGGWRYDGESNQGAPLTSGWNKNNINSVLRISVTDLDSTNRTSELAGIISGSQIQFAQTNDADKYFVFRVRENPVLVDSHYEYAVTLIDEGAGGVDDDGVSTMTANVPVAQETDFVRMDGYWPTNNPIWGTVEGFLQLDGVDQPGQEGNGFGVDVSFQRAIVPVDWDLAAYTKTSSSYGDNGLAGINQYKNKYIESLGLSSTSNEYYFDPEIKINESINIEGGEFLVYFGFEANASAINRSVVVGLFIDDVLIDSEYSMENKDITNNPYPMKIFRHDFEVGYHNFKVKFGRSGGGGGSFVTLKAVRIIIVPGGRIN